MRKLLILIISATTLASAFAGPLAVSAACLGTYPTIGTISSITTQGDYATFVLGHADAYDSSSFPGGVTSIDKYNDLAKAYKLNGYQVPAQYVRALQSYETADQIRNNLRIGVSNAALSKVSYQPGDIIILGPPGGGACIQHGFVGFFGTDGAIKSAIAYDSGLLSYSYGSETLSLSAGNDFNCSDTGSGGTKCQMPVTYTVNGSSVTMNGGDTRALGGSRFSQVSLITNSHTTLPNNMWMEDFDPHALLHVLSFGGSATVVETFSASPTTGPSPLSVEFSGGLNSFGMHTLDFGDGQSVIDARCSDSGPFGQFPCKMMPVSHTYSAPGTYTASLIEVILCATSGGGNIQCPTKYRTIGTATIRAEGGQSNSVFTASPNSGAAPLVVTFTGSTVSSYFGGVMLDFGDASDMTSACHPGGGCNYSLTHTYMSSGRYIARLVGVGEGSNSTLRSAQITVRNQSESPPPSRCPLIQRLLARGSRGSDVAALQNYFISAGVLGASSASGYFGPLTEGAVQEWQASHGLISYGSPSTTGWGIVGPRSRALLAHCEL